MAIDPLQRQMFRIPGVNPGQVAGGIYNLSNMGNANTTPGPVAAQPLQVASLPPNAQVARAAPVRLANNQPPQLKLQRSPSGLLQRQFQESYLKCSARSRAILVLLRMMKSGICGKGLIWS